MPQDAQRAVADLGAEDRASLLRLAALVADERADPARVVRAALVAVAARRAPGTGSGDVAAAVRDELVRRALGPARGRRGRPADGGTAGSADGTDDGTDGGTDALGRALASLPVRTRAAVALSCWAGLPGDAVGTALGCPVETVRTEVSRGSAALQPSLPAGRPLPRALDELARARTWGSDDGAWSGLHRELGRRRRRRAVGVLAAVCLLVLAAVAALQLVPGSPGDPSTAGPAEPGARVDLATLPTRGSLAGDEGFLDGVRRLPWTAEALTGYTPPVQTVPGTRRVLFAGDVPGARWALVVGRPELVVSPDAPPGPAPLVLPGDFYMAWFTGPPGAGPEEMTLSSYPSGLLPQVVPAFLDPGSGTLVVLAAPGDSVEVSPGVQIDADGADSRSWAEVETVDGVAITQVPRVDVPWNWSVAFRVHREGRSTLTSSPAGSLVPLDRQTTSLEVALPGPVAEGGRLAADLAALAILSATGAPTDDVVLTARAVAPVPPPATGMLAAVTATLPSGAVVVAVQWAAERTGGPPIGTTCGLEVRPAGSLPEDAVLVARCEVFDPVTDDPVDQLLLVLAPPEVAQVRVYREDGSFLAEHAVPDGGVVVVPAPGGPIRVEAVTAGGVQLGRTEPLGQWLPSD